jgi:phenylacetate-CoA ligase
LALIRPVLLYGYPSVLYLLAKRAAAHGRRDIRPRTIVTTSEMLFPGQRRVIEEAFAAPVFDQYGCNEVNLVSAECERHDGWHYAMESTLVEILDDDGLPVPTGRSGRIVGTSLDNLAMPFLRYDTGDIGALDKEPCACGRGLVRIRELQGRSRDLIRTPDGRFVHGVAFNDLMLEYPDVDRYQAVQTDERKLRVIVAGECDRLAACEESLRRQLGELTGLDVVVEINGEFEITVGRKARVVISRLDTGEGG